jgi:hypothetical protein
VPSSMFVMVEPPWVPWRLWSALGEWSNARQRQQPLGWSTTATGASSIYIAVRTPIDDTGTLDVSHGAR